MNRPALWIVAASLLVPAPSCRAAFSADDADNPPYSTDRSFEVGQNGGSGFRPWVMLNLDLSPAQGGRHLVQPGITGSYSWGLSGAYAMGRDLSSRITAGTWRSLAVHTVSNPFNSGFSGFSLKSSTSESLADGELLRFGLNYHSFGGGGICVSTDGGQNYTFLDCGWSDGKGVTLAYSAMWDGLGGYSLSVFNTSTLTTFKYSGTMAAGAVAMVGAVNYGSTLAEQLTFDHWEVTGVPEPAAAMFLPAAAALAVAVSRSTRRR